MLTIYMYKIRELPDNFMLVILWKKLISYKKLLLPQLSMTDKNKLILIGYSFVAALDLTFFRNRESAALIYHALSFRFSSLFSRCEMWVTVTQVAIFLFLKTTAKKHPIIFLSQNVAQQCIRKRIRWSGSSWVLGLVDRKVNLSSFVIIFFACLVVILSRLCRNKKKMRLSIVSWHWHKIF